MGKCYETKRSGGFASKLEHSLYDYLKLLEKGGEVTDIKTQVNVYLTDARILYIADFSAMALQPDGETYALTFYESKGMETQVWRIKRRLWLYYAESPLHVYKGSYKNLKLSEILTPKR